MKLLETIPGIGPVNASAIVATIGSTEGMFDHLTPDRHGFWYLIQPLQHVIYNLFMLQRLIWRNGLVVQRAFIGQLSHLVVQYEWRVWSFSTPVER